jgi:hypothetical protein
LNWTNSFDIMLIHLQRNQLFNSLLRRKNKKS